MAKVLIADDHLVTRKMLQTVLSKEGYEVVAAEDGTQAWDQLKNDPEIRLAVLDWMMPGLDGVEVCQKLQEENRSGLVYIILLTAKEGTGNLTSALQAGANDYITKPFEREELLARLRVGERMMELQRQLTQAQKLESIGQLASGIAHEINTPAQYVSDNAHFLREAFEDVNRLLQKFKHLADAGKSIPELSRLIAEVDALNEEIDSAYLTSEIPRAIEQSLEGVERVAHIVKAMKFFAHPGTTEKTSVDVNEAIESTITVACNKWKYVADMMLDLDPDLPLVPCFPGELNQVILNLLLNAADAVADIVAKDKQAKGTIRITTRRRDNWAEIQIADTGCGISQEIRDKIFNPFFTTKPVGKGSGQGLSISHSIVVARHSGTIHFETEIGKGTTFIVRLPLGSELTEDEKELEIPVQA